uniref:Uncharacterized protein n=1 Tax=Castor canadensis TaxID=51338 RepID=A0A8C0XE26_CASCN
MKLEEKRRAIEAQKKKMEAAFTKQRQKMGRTAFLTVVKKRGDGISPLREEAAVSFLLDRIVNTLTQFFIVSETCPH